MTIRELLIAVAGVIVALVVLAGGAFLLLQTDFTAFRRDPAQVDCTNANSSLCQLRNFLKAGKANSIESRGCIRYGLSADCAE